MAEYSSEIFNKACDYLSRRDHSEVELRKKLRRKFSEASLAEINLVINKLKELGFQSDARFTESFVRTKYYSKNGPVKIMYELKKKGIKKKVEFDEFNFDETALQFAKVRYAGQLQKYETYDREQKLKLKEKMYRGLAGRGFKYDTIKKVIGELFE